MLALVLLLGCPRDPCDTGPAVFELGGPGAPFVPLVDGDVLGIEQGPQGGWHTFVGLRVDGIDLADDAVSQTELPHVTLQIFDGDEPIAGYADLPRPFTDGGLLAPERVVFVGDPADRIGVGVLLDGEVRDRCGASASARVPVVLAR